MTNGGLWGHGTCVHRPATAGLLTPLLCIRACCRDDLGDYLVPGTLCQVFTSMNSVMSYSVATPMIVELGKVQNSTEIGGQEEQALDAIEPQLERHERGAR